ncbi:hypothetical protein IYX23_03545 [Methylocystis sp. L43]|uniref:hypothetical protein n=1 Tax=unclassified Methylocystis TaxID=2625913 RepID=UPI0018C3459C|nr:MULTISPECIES: hypothetical protein [unclassified Methylocystis]MBG0796771.1 hypothetical protein [Methylocystis sp. L43]MBG0806770.1 hypothetical protein [Methylocystis sp. H15]
MPENPRSVQENNIILLRGAAVWVLVALVLAWCLVALKMEAPFISAIFPGKFSRVLQAHIDFLLMSALLLGFYGTRIPFARPLRWAMVVGAFTNSSLFVLQAAFPILDGPPAEGWGPDLFRLYLMVSIVTTSFGFAGACLTVLRISFRPKPS